MHVLAEVECVRKQKGNDEQILCAYMKRMKKLNSWGKRRRASVDPNKCNEPVHTLNDDAAVSDSMDVVM